MQTEIKRQHDTSSFSLSSFSLFRYFPHSVSVTVTVTWVEQVNFALIRDQRPQPGSQVEEEEFQRLVENLSSAQGLKDLVQNYLPARSLHYRKHRERSDFLHGLHLSFPHITRLYR